MLCLFLSVFGLFLDAWLVLGAMIADSSRTPDLAMRYLLGSASVMIAGLVAALLISLFWGGFSALLGLLGQFTGMYRSLSVIVTAEVINPVMVMMGLKQTLNTTLYGFGQCLIAGVIWFILNSQAAKQRAA